jgi:hypothetical protein
MLFRSRIGQDGVRELDVCGRSPRPEGATRLHRLALFGLLLAMLPGTGHSQQDFPDRERYYRAVEFCRGAHVFPGSMLLSPDKLILCFDGVIARDMDVSAAKDLGDNGLFVVRSPGGYPGPAMTLSDIVRDRHGTVVVYDDCISACALFFLIASDQTYVLKGTLVVWHLSPDTAEHQLCTSLMTPRGWWAAEAGTRPMRERHVCRSRGKQHRLGDNFVFQGPDRRSVSRITSR